MKTKTPSLFAGAVLELVVSKAQTSLSPRLVTTRFDNVVEVSYAGRSGYPLVGGVGIGARWQFSPGSTLHVVVG